MPAMIAVSAKALASLPFDIARSTTALISALFHFCWSSRHSFIQIVLHAGFSFFRVDFSGFLRQG